jgi:tetratricopeptide (TPR) repeat protein
VFAALSFERLSSMKTPLSVWSDAIEKTDVKGPPNAVGRYRAFLNRGAEYLDRFSADLALNDFRAAQALGEPSGAALFNQGVALQVLKKHEDTLKVLAQAEAAGYVDGPLYYHRAESLMALRRWADAAAAYGQALERTLAPPVARQSRARHAEASMRLGRYGDAAQDFEALRREEPRQPRHSAGLGMAQIGLGDGAAALKTFDEALALPQPDTKQAAMAHYGRALALAQLKQAGPAREALAQAVQLDPQNPAYRQIQQQWAKDVSLPAAKP